MDDQIQGPSNFWAFMAASDELEIQRIEVFKKGYIPFIESQANQAKAAQQLLSSSVFAPEEKRILIEVLPEIDKQLSSLQSVTRQLLMEMNPSTMQKDSARDYHAFFKGDVLEHQLSFIVFMKTYILLAGFAKALSEGWRRVRDLVTASKLDDQSEFRKQLLHFRVGPALNDAEVLRLFTARMGAVMRLQKDPLTTRDIASCGEYRGDASYQLSSVFNIDLGGSTSTTSMLNAAQGPADFTFVGGSPAAAGNQTSAYMPPNVDSYRLSSGGSQSWNMTPYYYFTYDPRVLDAERLKLTNVVHIDMHMGADQNIMRSERILKYTRRMAEPQNQVLQQVESDYADFLTTFLNLVIEITTLNMSIPAKQRDVFLFHLGPQSFYYLTRRFLQELDTGTIHRKSGRGTVMEKFVPVELIKKLLLDWWRSNVLTRVGIERDDISQYKAIIKIVKDTYDRLSAKAMNEYNQMSEAQLRGRNRSDVIRENLNKWLGPTNIIVFRRFLKTGNP
ncbi:MAG: hypothetical protein K8S54_00865 [Spirochaetia bacterium]|nr:hypothetical protein [Spirochaetia bacterium]